MTGPSVRVLEGVSSSAAYGSADFGVSRDGSLIYVPGKLWGADRRLARVNRAGNVRPVTDTRRAFSTLSLSPDGHRLALTIAAANDQIWVYDLERSFSARRQEFLFEAKPLAGEEKTYDVTPDGEFLMVEPGESDTPPSQIDVVLNWLQDIAEPKHTGPPR